MSADPNLPDNWPAMSVADAHALMAAAPESPFEMEEAEIRGVSMRVWKNAPASLRDLFALSADHGDLPYMVYEDERISYAAHRKAVAHLATAMRERYGIEKGDRVALVMRNFPEWAVTFWAATTIGAVIVPLNAWWTGEELDYGLADCGAKLAVLDEERAARLSSVLPGLEALKTVLVARSTGAVAGATSLDEVIGKAADYDELDDIALPDADIAPEDNATIFYTSGTTGKPKGALGTHRNIMTNLVSLGVSSVRAMLRRGEIPQPPDPAAPKKSFLLSVPLFHATGCHSILVPNLAAGNCIVMMHKWDPLRALELIERERCFAFGGVPAMVWQVLEHPEFRKFDLSCVETVSYGGAPSAPELVARIKQEFPKAAPGNGYGLTETSSVTTQNVGEDYVNRPDSAGPAVPVCDLRVVDEQGEDVPAGQTGELWIKGPNIVAGYWNKPDATAKSFTKDGWFKSGDIVRMDEEGFVFILDRAKDMLIRGGENVYSVEIEDVLYAHPAVMDAAIVGIPHKVLGEEVGAVVQKKPGAVVSAAQLQAHVREHLAAFKVPVLIDIRDEPLPRNPNGKILKTKLRDEIIPLKEKLG